MVLAGELHCDQDVCCPAELIGHVCHLYHHLLHLHWQCHLLCLLCTRDTAEEYGQSGPAHNIQNDNGRYVNTFLRAEKRCSKWLACAALN